MVSLQFDKWCNDEMNHYLIMEFCEEGNLQQEIDRNGGCISEQQTQYYMGQIALMFEHIYTGGIWHRDLKPDNILLTTDSNGEKVLKICDFGLSKHATCSSNQTIAGTSGYRAPEVFLKDYNYKVDL